ncbi:MAG: hypothetical protein ACRDIY_07895 [Chloroflexota bacterium]
MPAKTITLALDGGVPLDQFGLAMSAFSGLIKSLSSELGTARKVEWIIDDLQAGSATATIRSDAADEEAIERVVQAYATVGRSLASHTAIPYSSDVARYARDIVSVLNGQVTSVRFETPDEDVILYSRSDRETNPERYLLAYGAVEGTIQTLTSRNRLRFTLYDSLFDKAVSCYVEEGREQIMLGVWGRRAIVEGLISRDAQTGRPVAVRQIRDIRVVLRPESASYRQARGIAPADESISAEAAIRKLRDA